MSFFGLEQNDLEKDKQNFLDGGLRESEDVAVYTWGEDSYDGLGDALQEGGDELNDETFGGGGKVGECTCNIVGDTASHWCCVRWLGKDFDFANQALPDDVLKPALNYAAAARDPYSQQQQQTQVLGQGASPSNGEVAPPS